MQRLILKSFQSPGDILMLTAAVRDLHRSHARKFQTDVRTSCDDLWTNNPFLTPLKEDDSDVESIDMHYPLIHQANQLPYHFIHGYRRYLEDRLSLRIEPSRFSGDIHLSDAEKSSELTVAGLKEKPFWLIFAGGKYDFTAKWWDPQNYQAVVDHFAGRIQFVQCGSADHWHPRLNGVIDLVGKTSLREVVRLTYWSQGVVCPVTFAMHLAAAVEAPKGRPRNRACVVVAGGREPPQWEAYPHHQFISTNGALSCCSDGGCWKSRCQQVDDGDSKDRHVCEQPVELRRGLSIPRCMHMITPEDVIRRIELYFDGGALQYLSDGGENTVVPPASRNGDCSKSHGDGNSDSTVEQTTEHRIAFYHGLGDAAYFARLIPMYRKRGHRLAVECTPDKRFIFEAAGASSLPEKGATAVHQWAYPPDHAPRAEHGNFWRGSKMGHNLSEAPLPNIGDKGTLWEEFVSTHVDIASALPTAAKDTAHEWLGRLQKPIVLFHQKGNTAQRRKSLPNAVASKFYESFLDQCDGTLILMDWDQRVPRLASHRIRHLSDLGKCTTEIMFAMMLEADLTVGVDSGPLHAANLARVPAMGIWMPQHYPSTYTLPRANQLNVVLSDGTEQWNRYKRIPWRIVEHSGNSFEGEKLTQFVAGMLDQPRYIPEDKAADVQMCQFVDDFCRCRGTSSLAHYWDRNRSFDVLLREMRSRFDKPTVVETGTIRAEEDWAGAGFFTYLMGTYLHHRGGRLHSVDIGAANCEFARTWTQVFGDTVSVSCEDSLQFLHRFSEPIHVLYVDSLDTTEPNHAVHALKEVQAVEAHLRPDALIVFDDSPWHAGATIGKGAEAVPWLLNRGWKIIYAGYQVIMSRTA
ncbi:MAG: glycosyltransferase family 9 protein [Fuerstiella sp.]